MATIEIISIQICPLLPQREYKKLSDWERRCDIPGTRQKYLDLRASSGASAICHNGECLAREALHRSVDDEIRATSKAEQKKPKAQCIE